MCEAGFPSGLQEVGDDEFLTQRRNTWDFNFLGSSYLSTRTDQTAKWHSDIHEPN